MSLEIDVQLLLRDPKEALLPVLTTIHGWEQASTLSQTNWDLLQSG